MRSGVVRWFSTLVRSSGQPVNEGVSSCPWVLVGSSSVLMSFFKCSMRAVSAPSRTCLFGS